MSAHRRLWTRQPTFLVCVALVLSACASGATPTPTRVLRTQTSVATLTPPPTAIPPTATVIPSPSPTATPAVPWPLTGLPARNAEEIKRPALAVKISNSPEARPQSGLQDADIVFEHLSEAGITRYTAIFHSRTVTEVGSVRSARLIDLEIPAMYSSSLAFSGASGPVLEMIYSSDFADRLVTEGDPGTFRKQGTGKAWEHTLFVVPDDLWKLAEKKGWPGLPDSRGMRFDAKPPTGGQPAMVAQIPYNSYYFDVTWTYSAERGGYLHSILGAPHLDALTGEQIAVSNVVILYVNHVDTLIVENEMGGRSIEIQLWGSGNATVLRDGQSWDVGWRRPNRSDAITLVMSDGETFPLKPGNTWYDLTPLNMNVTVQ